MRVSVSDATTIGLTIGIIGRAGEARVAVIDTVLLKVASRCNLNCTYCYVYNKGDTTWQGMPAQMSHFASDGIFAFARSRDGRLAISRGRQALDVVLIQRQ